MVCRMESKFTRSVYIWSERPPAYDFTFPLGQARLCFIHIIKYYFQPHMTHLVISIIIIFGVSPYSECVARDRDKT
jgi:hypothetical protein